MRVGGPRFGLRTDREICLMGTRPMFTQPPREASVQKMEKLAERLPLAADKVQKSVNPPIYRRLVVTSLAASRQLAHMCMVLGQLS